MELPFDLPPEEDTLPELTRQDKPLEVWLEKEALIQQLRNNLESFHALRSGMDGDVEGFLSAEELLEQRLELIRWLESYALTGVYVSLVPVSMRELRGDHGEDGPDAADR
jgi:hypothetical protein